MVYHMNIDGKLVEEDPATPDRPSSATEWTEIRGIAAREKEEMGIIAWYGSDKEESTSSLSYRTAPSPRTSLVKAPPPSEVNNPVHVWL